MIDKKIYIEKRRHKRFRAKDWVFAVWQSGSKLGRITDIGFGGFSFYYTALPTGQDQIEYGTHDMNIFDTQIGYRLEKARCKIIYDCKHGDSHELENLAIRRCGAQFLDLSHYQLSQLAYIIQDHAEVID